MSEQHELHGWLTKGEAAFDVAVRALDDSIAITVCRGVEGTRVHLSPEAAQDFALDVIAAVKEVRDGIASA